MQARLETRRFPTGVLAFAFALIAVVMLGAAGGYVMSILTAPAVHSAQGPITSTVQGGPNSDLTRGLPSGKVEANSSPCDSLRPHGIC